MMTKKNAMDVRLRSLFTLANHNPTGQIITDDGRQIYRDSDGTIERVYRVKDVAARGKTSLGRILFEYYQSGEHVAQITWAKRVANVINAINGNIAYVGQHDDRAHGMFVEPTYAPDYDLYLDIENALIINNNAQCVAEGIAARQLPTGELRDAYLANPCRETAWAAFVGGNPEDWDF